MSRTVACAVILFGIAQGCESKPNQVHFILPDGFRGAFTIKADVPDGVVLVKNKGCYVVRIPESGVLTIKGYDPFESFLCTASFSNGDEIWVEKRFGDKPRNGKIALLGGDTRIEWDANGKPDSALWWFVGTEEQWNAVSPEARNCPGRVLKE